MRYKILNADCEVMATGWKTETAAIERIQKNCTTDYRPLFVAQDDGEITALVYCGVVYRPTNVGLSNA